MYLNDTSCIPVHASLLEQTQLEQCNHTGPGSGYAFSICADLAHIPAAHTSAAMGTIARHLSAWKSLGCPRDAAMKAASSSSCEVSSTRELAARLYTRADCIQRQSCSIYRLIPEQHMELLIRAQKAKSQALQSDSNQTLMPLLGVKSLQ